MSQSQTALNLLHIALRSNLKISFQQACIVYTFIFNAENQLYFGD